MFVLTSDMSQNKVHCAHGGSGLTLRVVRGDPSMGVLVHKTCMHLLGWQYSN
jgi:hypothetical protein